MKWRQILVGVLVCCLSAATVMAQTSGALSAEGDAVTFEPAGAASAVFQISGTFVGTITFEASVSGNVWTATVVARQSTYALASTATTTDTYLLHNPGYTKVRARMSSYTSGTAVVSIGSGPGIVSPTELSTAGDFWSRTSTTLAPTTADDIVTFSAGTAAAPGLAVVGDADSGLYRIGANNLGIALGGAIEWNLTAAAFSPGASNGSALGTTSLMWADLFVASGGVINFNNGDVTVTHAANTLSFGGATTYPFDAPVYLADGSAAAPALTFTSDPDSGLYSIGANNVGLALNGAIEWDLTTSAFSPGASDGSALGTASLMWSDLFLASGGVINFNNGNATLTHSAGLLTSNVPVTATKFNASSPAITAGSGTGVTVDVASEVRRVIYKVTVDYTQFDAAATTHDLTIATLPAKTRLVGVYADLTTPFVCAAVCTTATLSMTVGTSAGGNEILASFDLDAAAAVFGDADAELGASVNAAGRVQDAYIAAWAATQIITLRGTSGTGNWGDGAGATNLNAGSVTFYLITEVMP